MTQQSVRGKLDEAFPGLLRDVPKSKYWSFNFGYGATIYVPYGDPNCARVTLSSLDNGRFPNSDKLKTFAETNIIGIHGIGRGGEYWFRSQHVDSVIAILKNEQSNVSPIQTGSQPWKSAKYKSGKRIAQPTSELREQSTSDGGETWQGEQLTSKNLLVILAIFIGGPLLVLVFGILGIPPFSWIIQAIGNLISMLIFGYILYWFADRVLNLFGD